MPNVRIPVPLRKITDNKEIINIKGETVGEVLLFLCARYVELQDRLLDENGEVRRFINIFLNDEDIRFINENATPCKEDDEISIVPAIAGG
jgi:molybdopterin synthase sulfur carrier subunit